MIAFEASSIFEAAGAGKNRKGPAFRTFNRTFESVFESEQVFASRDGTS